MRALMIMLPMMFLALGASSCGSTARKLVCSQVRSLEVKPIPACDMSFQFNRCRCRCFNFNTWETLPLNQCPKLMEELDANMSFEIVVEKGEEGKNFPLEYCEGVAGFFVEDMANEIRPNVKGLSRIKADYCD